MTYQVIYSSQATHPLSVGELQCILHDARAGNERRGITGALVYVEGVFLQVLEGERGDVVELMRNIARDSRHADVKVFHEAEVDAPAFHSWHMANIEATPEMLAQWVGLPGVASMSAILDELHADPAQASQVVVRMLEAIYP